MLSCSRSECYYEEPHAGKPHVRFCEGLVSRGISLLDFSYLTDWYQSQSVSLFLGVDLKTAFIDAGIVRL